MKRLAVASAALFLLSACQAFALQCFAGDSLANGMAISYCASLPRSEQAACRALNFAKDGAPTAALVEQLKRCPAGALVRVSAGTNDAVFPGNRLETFAPNYEKIVARVLAVADARRQVLVWYAPPPVRYRWNFYSQIAANQLRIMLSLTSHRYVETRDADWSAVRAPDGIHFTIPRGYLALYHADRN